MHLKLGYETRTETPPITEACTGIEAETRTATKLELKLKALAVTVVSILILAVALEATFESEIRFGTEIETTPEAETGTLTRTEA